MLPVVVLKAEVAGRGPEGYVGGTAGDWGCWLLWTGLEPFLAGDYKEENRSHNWVGGPAPKHLQSP